jgi:hypothetical protein
MCDNQVGLLHMGFLTDLVQGQLRQRMNAAQSRLNGGGGNGGNINGITQQRLQQVQLNMTLRNLIQFQNQMEQMRNWNLNRPNNAQRRRIENMEWGRSQQLEAAIVQGFSNAQNRGQQQQWLRLAVHYFNSQSDYLGRLAQQRENEGNAEQAQQFRQMAQNYRQRMQRANQMLGNNNGMAL